jgi:hypothetical protein
MSEFKAHAEKLVKDYKHKRAMILSKRRKLIMNSEEEVLRKLSNYKKGLEFLSSNLISALDIYKEVFNNSLPEITCYMKIKSKYPNDIDITFSIKDHAIRFLSRAANKGEEFQNVLIDGLLYLESTYQGSNRKLEAQIGLLSDIGPDAWGVKGHNDELLYFLSDMLPGVMESFWNSATLVMVHSH